MRGQKPLPATYPTELHTVGDHLRKRRLDLRLLQREVAEQIGVDTTTITNWELGHTTPALCRMPNVIQFLGYDPQPQPETLGQALKRRRQVRGMSQREMAKRLGVDPATVGRSEREARIPAGEFLRRVQILLGTAAE